MFEQQYMLFACPQHECTSSGKMLTEKITAYNKKKTFKLNGGGGKPSHYNCRIRIHADSSALKNGKLRVKLKGNEIEQNRVYVYLQPDKPVYENKVTGEPTHGSIDENGMFYNSPEINSVYEVPTDWSVYFSYNVFTPDYRPFGMRLELQIEVIPYTEDDVENLESIWLPTDTFFGSGSFKNGQDFEIPSTDYQLGQVTIEKGGTLVLDEGWSTGFKVLIIMVVILTFAVTGGLIACHFYF
mmetsp:Transcript_18701/g.28651  ORF Transcript_18701/g.28651 Transcript_18701/m.28651 type:complete len:241 (+) Transcript_18701:241-963(+)|eukprot:CAMPEP_0170480408 /NCGR_PEP_ID=MMETSP0208-20121228/1260_1 /TAXON_ID=197538 /ORGANISM="Strombidium inclinatum, Strain S3" /LENGTH=240 /DNA_ID=CAMNT_0010752951 /DNA_START=210 /DNA_END=932 /DNA_ORIENTATION=+